MISAAMVIMVMVSAAMVRELSEKRAGTTLTLLYLLYSLYSLYLY